MLLRGFASKYMNNVYRGPDDEGGADADVDTDLGDVGGSDGADGTSVADGGHEDDGGAGEEQVAKKPLSIREELKKTIADAQKADAEREQQRQPKKPKEAKQAAKPADGTQQQAAPQGGATAPPASLPKELHAEWANAPKAIQDAFIKREQDMQRGVDELKQRYSKIDEALAPHQEALRQMNATPADAVNRMFLWFKALSNSPAQAFPGLAQSLGFDWNRLTQAATQGAQQQQQPDQQQQQQDVIPEPVKQYISQLEQRLGQLDGRFNGIQSEIQASNMAKTQENLSLWSKDKEFFQEVRQDMAAMIQSGMIPPLANGQVDLDTAYERAIHYNPEVRAKVLAKQQQANAQVQQQATNAATTARQQQTQKARKAASSLPTGNAPGQTPSQQQQRKPGQRTSVRDSLREAIAQLRDSQ